MTRFAVGIGSNEGERLGHLIGAVEDIEKRVGAVDVSGLYETEPVGGPDQDPFLNAVVAFQTDRSPPELLDYLQSVEADHGRKRTVKWGPRTLDLDIVTSDAPFVSDATLSIPHPRARDREFVLRPLADVWPDAPVGEDLPAEVALNRVGDQGVDRLAREWYPASPRWIAPSLLAGQFVLFIAAASALAFGGTLPEGEVTILRVLGAALAMAGMILAFVSSRRLGPAMTASPIPRENSVLVMTGPYRYVRHPIYGGVSLVLIGTALFLDSLGGLAVSALLLPFFWMKSSFEERQLRIRHPGYRTYRQVVHRRLLPFLI